MLIHVFLNLLFDIFSLLFIALYKQDNQKHSSDQGNQLVTYGTLLNDPIIDDRIISHYVFAHQKSERYASWHILSGLNLWSYTTCVFIISATKVICCGNYKANILFISNKTDS